MSEPLTPSERRKALEFIGHRQRYGGQILFFEPYVKQREFLDLGALKRERLLIAGNQNGKSITGSFEAACHLTGEYPGWWAGRKFDKPTRGWICGETGEVVRDVAQRKLFGTPGVDAEWGTGMIPKASLLDRSLSNGARDLVDTVQVRHKSGGVSTVSTKSYEQGRRKFQGESLDWLWFDEEPPPDVYSEGLTRTTATNGVVFVTFTPLNGPTDVVLRFLDEPNQNRAVVNMTIDDALHISPEQREAMMAAWPPHEREARARGTPMLGSGRIFTASEESILEERMEVNHIPPFWWKLWGIDFGIDHPFGAVLILWDKDADVIHVHHCHRVKDALPIQHAEAIRRVGASAPVAWPADGNIRRDDGKPMAEHYRRHGVRMLQTHATWPDGSVSTEAGILEIDEREKAGAIKYANTLTDLLAERRLYHRKDGKIVKFQDDLISALRVAIMMKRFAKQVPLGPGIVVRADAPRSQFARGTPNHPDGDMNPMDWPMKPALWMWQDDVVWPAGWKVYKPAPGPNIRWHQTMIFDECGNWVRNDIVEWAGYDAAVIWPHWIK